MRILLLSFFLIFSVSAKSKPPEPKLISINLIDQNGTSETISSPDRLKKYAKTDFFDRQSFKKVMRIYARDEKGTMKALLTTYYPNGQVHQYLEVVNGRALGNYTEWHENGQIKIQANVIGGDPDLTEAAEKTWVFEGYSYAYDPSGSRLADIPYSKGFLEGCATYYHPKGTVWKTIPYLQGNIHGMATIFLENGTIFQQNTYFEGALHGRSIRYWSPNLIASDETYDRGKLVSGTYFDQDKSIITKVENGFGKRTLFGKESPAEIQEIKKGVPEGRVELYSANGNLVSTHYLKEGQKHGEEMVFFAGTPLKPKLSVNWYQGKIRGLVRSWHPNGQLESQRELADNIKNGLLSAWYLDGSLMLLEEYDQDKLVKGEYFRMGEKRLFSEVNQGKGTATLFDPEGHFLRKISYQNGRPSN